MVSLTHVFWMNIDLKWVVLLPENWSVFTLAFKLRVWWNSDWFGVWLCILPRKNSTCGEKRLRHPCVPQEWITAKEEKRSGDTAPVSFNHIFLSLVHIVHLRQRVWIKSIRDVKTKLHERFWEFKVHPELMGNKVFTLTLGRDRSCKGYYVLSSAADNSVFQ